MRDPGIGRTKYRRAFLLPILVAGMLLLPEPAQAAPPGNDAFANAVDVMEPLPFSDSVSNTEATREAGEPRLEDSCGVVRRTVWYSYTPSSDAVVSVNTLGSDFDTVLGVWQGSDLNALSLVGCNDDALGDVQSTVLFSAQMGTEYRFQVGGFHRESGDLVIHVRQTSEAGFIEGTVTKEGSTAPLEGICVQVVDLLFGTSPSESTSTAADGSYQVVARPGEYAVGFTDCTRDSYIPEWWDDVSSLGHATEVVVTGVSSTQGIDAALTSGCPGWGSSGINQVVGTGASETLIGTPHQDVICGFGGDDVLRGGGGNDHLIGGKGDDAMSGGLGSDFISGLAGDDSLVGGPGGDSLFGGPGRDACWGGSGRDRVGSCEEQHGIP